MQGGLEQVSFDGVVKEKSEGERPELVLILILTNSIVRACGLLVHYTWTTTIMHGLLLA